MSPQILTTSTEVLSAFQYGGIYAKVYLGALSRTWINKRIRSNGVKCLIVVFADCSIDMFLNTVHIAYAVYSFDLNPGLCRPWLRCPCSQKRRNYKLVQGQKYMLKMHYNAL